ncbi:hypothetical protein J6590_096070 [Homalodisca vitripennis]|nr:hypothetical protein J6590_004389 [Homalodisca vitripennis]KAG8274972.1 hypothetical protein J6590_096566 [Homalodisca vitripennis]KAG8334197.1 hypothetical protein J6590_096070 [Homalodisca vitripennis]
MKIFIVMLSLILVPVKTQHIKSRREEPQRKHGNVEFSTLVLTGQYIDKSLLVNEFFENRDDYIIYVTAPSGFGKSVNIEMLKSFLEIQVDKNGTEITNKSTTNNFKLFTGLKIFQQHPQLFNWTFGLYPVVTIDYQLLSTASYYEDMVGAMRLILGNTFKNHEYLAHVDNLWGLSCDIDTFIEYLDTENYPTLSEVKIKTGFLYLCKILSTYFKRKVVVLIDQYDSFVNSIVFEHNTAGKAFNLFQYINGDLFMGGRSYIQRIFCTGTLQVVFGGLLPVDQDLQCYPFLHKHQWNSFFGLTSEDVDLLLEEKYDAERDLDIKHTKDHIRKYYGGYNVIGNATDIYKIQPVINCASFKTYDTVVNDNSTDHIYDFLSSVLKYIEVKECFVKLLQDENEISIENDLALSENDFVTLQKMFSLKEYTITSNHLLVILKYLLQIGILSYKTHTASEYVLSLPNSEVKLKLKSCITESKTYTK